MTAVRPVTPLLVLALVTAGCSVDTETARQEYLKSGDALAAEGKVAEAIVEYRNAVQQDPRFGEARLKLADAYVTQGDAANALRHYIRAADVMPDNVTAQLKAATILLIAGQFEDARVRAEKALEKEPANVDALILRANALANLKRLDDALAEVEEAVKVEPSRATSYTALGALRAVRGERNEAEGAFKRAIEVDPKSVAAHLALAQFYWATGRLDVAEAALKTAVSLDGRNVMANRTTAAFYGATGREAEAEPFVKVVAEAQPSGGQLMMADFYLGLRRFEDARGLLEKITSDSPEFAKAQVRLAALARAKNDASGAMRLLDDVLAREPANEEALVGKASLLVQQRKFDEALKVAETATRASPASAEAHYWLARSQRGRGDLLDATRALTETLRLNPQLVVAELELAQINLALGKVAEAEQFVQNVRQRVPNAPEGQLLAARIALAKGDVASAEPLLTRLVGLLPEAAAVQREVGRLQLQKKNFGAARAALEKAYMADSSDAQSLSYLISIDLKESKPADAKARADTAMAKHPRNGRILALGGRVYANLRDLSRAEQLFRQAIEVDPTTNEAYAMLGALYHSQGRIDQAIKEFTTLEQRNPKAIGPPTLLGTILQAQNRRAEAKEAFLRAIAIDSTAAVASNNLAWMYVEDNENLDQALHLAQVARTYLPESTEVADTVGWIYFRRGLASTSVAFLKEAVDKQPDNAGYQYHLGLAYAKTGEIALARRLLSAALKLSPNAPEAAEAREALAQIGTGS